MGLRLYDSGDMYVPDRVSENSGKRTMTIIDGYTISKEYQNTYACDPAERTLAKDVEYTIRSSCDRISHFFPVKTIVVPCVGEMVIIDVKDVKTFEVKYQVEIYPISGKVYFNVLRVRLITENSMAVTNWICTRREITENKGEFLKAADDESSPYSKLNFLMKYAMQEPTTPNVDFHNCFKPLIIAANTLMVEYQGEK